MMPPAGAPRPDRATLDRLAAHIEGVLDKACRIGARSGPRVLHRLNRAEYANAVRDLLDLPIDSAALLPGDDSAEGFDNIASVLSVSPALMQAYVSAAAKISRLAVGDPTTSPGIATYAAPRGLSQADHREGQPLGTRGGIVVQHVFPLDAEYDFRVGRTGSGFGLTAVGGDEQMEITLDGERLRVLGRDARDVRIKVPAGPHSVGVAVVRKANARGVDDLFAEYAMSVGVSSVSITGPVRADRARRHAEPAADLRVPAVGEPPTSCRARGGSSPAWPRAPSGGRWPKRTRPSTRCSASTNRATSCAASRPASSTRWRACSSIRSSSSGSSASRRTCRWAPSTASAISSWPRGCPSSSGAACPTRSC